MNHVLMFFLIGPILVLMTFAIQLVRMIEARIIKRLSDGQAWPITVVENDDRRICGRISFVVMCVSAFLCFTAYMSYAYDIAQAGLWNTIVAWLVKFYWNRQPQERTIYQIDTLPQSTD